MKNFINSQDDITNKQEESLVCVGLFFFLLIIFTDSVQIGAEEGANTISFFSRPTIHAHLKSEQFLCIFQNP